MKKLYTEDDILKLSGEGNSVIYVTGHEVFTPLALDKAKELKITLKKKTDTSNSKVSTPNISKASSIKKIALGSDHTGFETKKIISGYLVTKGFDIVDVGTFDDKSCDYPDFSFEVAKKVVLHDVDAGIIFDATGIPSAITANKVPGIRAATCYNEFSARSSREHNNANVLVLGAKILGIETIKSILDTWLVTDFLGERHQRRLDKITKIELLFINKEL
ncbi:ribose-5-phosphate isomerase B [bacterium BMS3Abin04]|nr:ribose-5-phosphate isomerase B [bacterium BMS3Abin04]